MPTKKKPRARRAAPPPPDILEGDEFPFDEETAAEMELAEFVEAIGTSASFIAVYRAGRPGESDAFLENVTCAGFNEQVLRDNYGPGKYHLKFKGPNRQGRIVYKAHKTSVIGEIRPTAPGANGPAAVDSRGDETKRLFELILAMIAAQKGPDLSGLAAIIAAVNPNKGGNDLAAVLSAVKTAREITEPRDPIAHLATTVDLVKKMIPETSGGGKDEGWAGIVKDVLGAIVPGAGAAGGGRALPPGQGPAAAAAPQPDPDEGEEVPATTEQWLKAQIEFLKTKALQGRPAEPWIAYTVENSDELGCAAILTAVRQGATFQHLLMYFPEIASNPQLRVWFQAFYEGLTARINNPGPATRGGGNLANPASDAGPSPDGSNLADNPSGSKFAF